MIITMENFSQPTCMTAKPHTNMKLTTKQIAELMCLSKRRIQAKVIAGHFPSAVQHRAKGDYFINANDLANEFNRNTFLFTMLRNFLFYERYGSELLFNFLQGAQKQTMDH